ncbi:MAG TPA: Mrp/NBP35 family ATP-binding protein [Actinopolymorphaceae bacterium]|jgi:ATP-binding protein involved in chromosome partitioning
MPVSTPSSLPDLVREQLATVLDPEIRRPITEIDMVESVLVDPNAVARITILLTVSGCPMRDKLTEDVTGAALRVDGVRDVAITFGVMTDEQRKALQTKLRGGAPAKENKFTKAGSLTRVFAVASGKGGVGKSAVTTNLAVGLAKQGLKVGVLDADIYGHSIPVMFGVADERPTRVEEMIMPITAHGVRLISIGMLKPKREQVVAWRGPMLDKALAQMLSDVYWGDLDILLLDLPPGTGDVAISVGQQLGSGTEVLVVTTPQDSAAEVAERAGTMASMLEQKVIGIVENMSYLVCPHCGPEHKLEVFGSGGGERVASTLTTRLGYDIPVLAHIPLDPRLGAGADAGMPLVLSDPDSPAALELARVAGRLAGRSRGLLGRRLGLTPVS